MGRKRVRKFPSTINIKNTKEMWDLLEDAMEIDGGIESEVLRDIIKLGAPIFIAQQLKEKRAVAERLRKKYG